MRVFIISRHLVYRMLVLFVYLFLSLGYIDLKGLLLTEYAALDETAREPRDSFHRRFPKGDQFHGPHS